MTIRISILFTLSFLMISILGNSFPEIANTNEQVNSISSVHNSMSYWDILLSILGVLIIVPFIYIGYLKTITIKSKYTHYHFNGEYNIKCLIEHIQNLELSLNKSFPKFKKSIIQCDKGSKGEIVDYAEAIDSNLFCIKLNGEARLTAFWNSSDPFLKSMLLSLPIVGIVIVLVSNIYFGLTGLVLSLISLIFILPIIFTIFSWFLQFSQYILRKRGKAVPALSLSLFSIEALINRNVERTQNTKTGEYYYYSTISKYNNLVNADSFQRGIGVHVAPNPYSISGVLEDYKENKD